MYLFRIRREDMGYLSRTCFDTEKELLVTQHHAISISSGKGYAKEEGREATRNSLQNQNITDDFLLLLAPLPWLIFPFHYLNDMGVATPLF